MNTSILCRNCEKFPSRYLLECLCLLCDQCKRVSTQKCPVCQSVITKIKDLDNPKYAQIRERINLNVQLHVRDYELVQLSKLKRLRALESKISEYKKAVDQLVYLHPNLSSYFESQISTYQPRKRQSVRNNKHRSQPKYY